MAASVTVHHKAFGDERIHRLAELAGYSHMEALGRLVRLWSTCTELQTDMLTPSRVRACLGDRGDEHLIEAELGEAMDGGIRVRGRFDDQGKDRFRWYSETPAMLTTEQRSAGGKSRSSKAPRDAKGRLLSSRSPAGSPGELEKTSSSSSYPDPRSDLEQPGSGSPEESAISPEPADQQAPTEDSRPPEPPRGASRPAEPPEEPQRRTEPEHAIGKRVFEKLLALRRTVAAELGLQVRDIQHDDIGSRALRRLIRESRIAKVPDERIEGDLNHVIAVFAAEARLTKSVQWLTTGMFEDRSYRRALGMTLADVATSARRAQNANHGAPREPEKPIRMPAWGDHTAGGSS